MNQLSRLLRLAGILTESTVTEAYAAFKDFSAEEFIDLQQSEGLTLDSPRGFGVMVKSARGDYVGIVHNQFSAFGKGSARLLRDRSTGYRTPSEISKSMNAFESINEVEGQVLSQEEQDEIDNAAIDKRVDAEREIGRMIILAARKCGLEMDNSPVYFPEEDEVEFTLSEEPTGIPLEQIMKFAGSGVGSAFRVGLDDQRRIVLIFKFNPELASASFNG